MEGSVTNFDMLHSGQHSFTQFSVYLFCAFFHSFTNPIIAIVLLFRESKPTTAGTKYAQFCVEHRSDITAHKD